MVWVRGGGGGSLEKWAKLQQLCTVWALGPRPPYWSQGWMPPWRTAVFVTVLLYPASRDSICLLSFRSRSPDWMCCYAGARPNPMYAWHQLIKTKEALYLGGCVTWMAPTDKKKLLLINNGKADWVSVTYTQETTVAVTSGGLVRNVCFSDHHIQMVRKNTSYILVQK